MSSTGSILGEQGRCEPVDALGNRGEGAGAGMLNYANISYIFMVTSVGIIVEHLFWCTSLHD